jgi:hypothetical protein
MSLEVERVLNIAPKDMGVLLGNYDPLVWATDTANIRLPKTGPLTFERHPYLIGLYRDTTPNIVALKGAQLGMSTWAILRSLWALTTWPMSVIYTSGVGISGYTQARINPIILASPYLTDRILDIDSLQQKRFSLRGRSEYDPATIIGRYQRQRTMTAEGSSTLYFTSGSNPREAQARDADFLIHDEEDRSDPEVIEQYRSRISGPSPFKWIVRLSTPTVPGYGIDRAFRLTDMRHWFIRCPGCNESSEMQFPQSLEPQTWEEHVATHPVTADGDACPDCYYICAKCKRRMTDAERAVGQWVPEVSVPGLPHGYTVSQMAALYIPANAILKARFDAIWETSFHNLTMGVAYDEGTEAFDRHTLIGSNIVGDTGRADPMRPMEMSGSGCTMGVDVGAMLDIVISRTENGVCRTIRMVSTPDWSELNRLMDTYHVSTCVIDARPEEVAVRQFQAQYNTPNHVRVYRAYYTGPTSKDVLWNEAEATVTAPRSRLLSEMATELLSTRLLPRYDGSADWERFILHFENSKRVPRFERGLERAQVVESYEWVNVGPDHMFHASVYDYLARNAPRAFMPPIIGLYSLNRSKMGH